MTEYTPPWVTYDRHPAPVLNPAPPPLATPVSAVPAAVAPAPGMDLGDQFQRSIQDATQSALIAAAPAIQQQLSVLTQSYVDSLVAGKPMSPVITATINGRDLTVASAKNRSWRTLLGGLWLDMLFALVAVVGMAGNIDFFSKAGWTMFGILVAKTLIQTVVSYFARIKVTPAYEK